MSTDRALETLTAEDFRGQQGTCFLLTGGGDKEGSGVSHQVELADVTESAAAGAFRAPFSVLFHGPLAPVLAQGIYRLEHDQLGSLELFIVPVGPSRPAAPGQAPATMGYEAVFG